MPFKAQNVEDSIVSTKLNNFMGDCCAVGMRIGSGELSNEGLSEPSAVEAANSSLHEEIVSPRTANETVNANSDTASNQGAVCVQAPLSMRTMILYLRTGTLKMSLRVRTGGGSTEMACTVASIWVYKCFCDMHIVGGCLLGTGNLAIARFAPLGTLLAEWRTMSW